MDTTVTSESSENVWGGGNRPLGASYGKTNDVVFHRF